MQQLRSAPAPLVVLVSVMFALAGCATASSHYGQVALEVSLQPDVVEGLGLRRVTAEGREKQANLRRGAELLVNGVPMTLLGTDPVAETVHALDEDGVLAVIPYEDVREIAGLGPEVNWSGRVLEYMEEGGLAGAYPGAALGFGVTLFDVLVGGGFIGSLKTEDRIQRPLNSISLVSEKDPLGVVMLGPQTIFAGLLLGAAAGALVGGLSGPLVVPAVENVTGETYDHRVLRIWTTRRGKWRVGAPGEVPEASPLAPSTEVSPSSPNGSRSP